MSRYLKQCIRVPSQNFQHNEIWKKFGDEFVVYNKERTTIDNIIQPIHRLLHQMLINTICHREDKRKNVLENDVFLLHCLIDNQVHLNIPFMMAIFLSYSSLRDRYTQPLCGAQFITRIAQSYGLINHFDTKGMWVYDLKKLRVEDFIELNLLEPNFKKMEVMEEDYQNSSEQFQEEENVYPIMRIQQETRDAIRSMELKVMKLKNELKRDIKLMDERTF